MRRMIALLLAMVLSLGIFAMGASAAPAQAGVSFAEEFKNPTNTDYKPFVRYWFAPGRMEEEETRREIRTFAELGFGGVELISLEMTTVEMNGPEWNEVMMWIMDEADKCGLQIDVTLGEFWPIASNMITVEDRYKDSRSEQKLVVHGVEFTADADNMVYEAEEWILPPGTPSWGGMNYPINPNEPWTAVAVTVAKKNEDGTFDPATAVDISASVNMQTGAVSWTAPSEGQWSVFYSYQQATGKYLSYGVDNVVIDHLSKEASELIIQDFEDAFEMTPGLKELYQKVGGCFFGDSLELSACTTWTGTFLEEFRERRGYDLTPYLPTLYAASGIRDAQTAVTYEFDGIGMQIRNDYGTTLSELYTENHLQVFDRWAEEELDMDLRYQVYRGVGAMFMDNTLGSLAVDIPETESLDHDNLDWFREKSGVTHMKNSLLGAEAAESSNQDWRQTWTGSNTESGSTTSDMGFMHYTNRMFATGVNKLTFHGASYHVEGPLPQLFGGGDFMPTFPGYSLMAGMNYSNEWDDKTPLAEYAPEMLGYLTRAQMILQQGQGDIDLAVYRLQTTPDSTRSDPYEINNAGYNFDFVTENILNLDNAVVGTVNGETVLAPNGPSYKALIVDQRTYGGENVSYAMTVTMAQKLLGYAKAGLPVVIVGEVPSIPASMNDDAATLKSIMNEVLAQDSVICIETDAELETALRAHGIVPDADPDVADSTMFYHRTTEDAEFYFMANDSRTDAVKQVVTFRGEGRPYLLDAWSGEITPIAQYTVEDGAVTVAITLEPEEQMFLAVAPEDWFNVSQTGSHVVASNADSVIYSGDELLAKTSAAGDYTVTLDHGEVVEFTAEAPEDVSIESWDLVIHQWKPLNLEDTTYKPYEHQIIDSGKYTLANTDAEMLPWYAIDRENLLHTMGVGEYTARITLEKGWQEGQGAILNFTDVADTMELTVNGEMVPVDQINKDTDIGPWLVAGENTIVVKVATSAANVVYAKKAQAMWGPSIPAEATTFDFGILGAVSFETYTVSSVFDPAVTLNLSGATEAVVGDMLTYTLRAENAVKLATATVTLNVSGNVTNATAEGVNGWYIIAQEYADGILSVVAANNEGVSSEEAVDMLNICVATNGKTGSVTICVSDADLSAYVGNDREDFVAVLLGEAAALTTKIDYNTYDVNCDGTVDQLDITRAQRAYGAVEGDTNWNAHADVDGNGIVEITDFILILNNYSK